MISSRQGFSIVEIFLVLIFISLLAGLGYVGYTRFIAPETTINGESSPSSQVNDSTSGYTSTEDLNDAATELDAVDLEETKDDSNLATDANQL